MQMWIGLWLVAAIVEVAVYAAITDKVTPHKYLRWSAYGLAAIFTLFVATMLVIQNWQVWALPWFVGLYRLINLARAASRRLQADRLRTSSLSALSWLLSLQAVFALTFWLVQMHSLWYPLLAVLAVSQLFVALTLLRTTLQTWQYTEPATHSTGAMTDKELPSLSVLIPARNETDALEACLQSLIASDYPKLEIIALDDCSTNKRTAEIIRRFAQDGVRFVKGGVPDERWLAKNYAYQQLADSASGDVLLFCGVDVLVEPQSLRRMVEMMTAENREMISVLPQRLPEERRRFSMLQPMRYYWEVCFPRRLFKRPPVLSTCWLITRDAFEHYGGFAAASQTITPEAHLAKKAVVANAYTFVRSTDALPLYSTKSIDAQYDTMIRVRYPQLHRRLEMVAFAALFELVFILGPFLALLTTPFLHSKLAFGLIWLTAAVAITVLYSLVAIQTRLNSILIGLVTTPLAFVVDVFMLHNSMFKYEFGTVVWKERNICIPVMRMYDKQPDAR